MWWTVWSNKPQNDCLLRREAAEEAGRSSAVRQNFFLVCWVFFKQSWLIVILMLISHPLGSRPPIIFCAHWEVQFLPLGQNTCSAQQQLVDTWILLQVSLSCLTLVWLLWSPQFPAGNQVAFWHVLLNPFWKQLSWGARQVCSQQHRWGCISLRNQPLCICQVLPLPFPAALTVVYFSCSFAPVFTIDPVSHQTSSQLAKCWLVAKGCPWPSLTGRTMLVPCACLLRGFIWCLTMTPCQSKELKEREGDALGLQVTVIFSLDFVDADQCWHKHRITEIGFEPNSLWKNSQGWCNGRSESASLNIRDRMTWMQAEPQPGCNPGS